MGNIIPANSIVDALAVIALAAVAIAYMFIRHRERQRRLEIVHQERLTAMEKGIPLPEFPLDPPRVPKPPDPREPLLHGIVWVAFGGGAMIAAAIIGVRLTPTVSPALSSGLWALPLPLLLLGVGLILYYVLASRGR